MSRFPTILTRGETGGADKIGTILSEIRVMTAALAVGLARAAYGAALTYSRERVAFGKPIGEHQAISFKLADMLTSIHAAAVLTYQAAARMDAGHAIGREAAMTKLFASEAAVKVTDEAARIFASYGLAMEYPVQRYFRDARFLLPGGGTSEILRVVIGRELDWDRARPLIGDAQWRTSRRAGTGTISGGRAFERPPHVEAGDVGCSRALRRFQPAAPDEEFAKTTPFGGRVALRILTLAISNGHQNQLGIFEGNELALLGIDRIRFTGPVRLGDTVHTAMTTGDEAVVQARRAW